MMEAFSKKGPEEAEELGEAPALFDVVLTPHRSLGPRGFLVLMVAVSLIGFGGGVAFALAGAWPVFGFLGLDVALIYIAFRVSYRQARMYETLRLTENSLVVERVNPSGKVQNWQFQPYWLRVDMEDPPLPDSPLTLNSHGRSLEVGKFLTAEERAELACALRDALEDLRQPRYGAGE